MKKQIIWFILVVLTALLQTTWLERIRVAGVTPDLMLLLVVYIGLTEGESRAMATAVLGGIFKDVAADMTLGHHVLGLTLVGYMAGRITRRLVTEHPAIKTALVLGGALLNGLLFTAVLFIQKPDTPAMITILAEIIPGAFYTALVTPLVFWGLDKVLGKTTVQEGAAPQDVP